MVQMSNINVLEVELASLMPLSMAASSCVPQKYKFASHKGLLTRPQYDVDYLGFKKQVESGLCECSILLEQCGSAHDGCM
jgi:hypothetical protein